MNPNKSHITLLVDRSGSMARNRDDAEGAVNQFVADQAKVPGECSLLLIDFDAPHFDPAVTEWWYNICHDGDIGGAKSYHLQPRGGTALLDAMGQAITQTGERLAAIPEDERPGKVFFVVQTDGGENSSRDWKLPFLIETIKHQEMNYQWTFIFLGMGPEAFAQSQMFVGTQMVRNTTQSADTGAAYMGSYGAVGRNIAQSRGGQHVNSYAAKVKEDGTVEQEENA